MTLINNNNINWKKTILKLKTYMKIDNYRLNFEDNNYESRGA